MKNILILIAFYTYTSQVSASPLCPEGHTTGGSEHVYGEDPQYNSTLSSCTQELNREDSRILSTSLASEIAHYEFDDLEATSVKCKKILYIESAPTCIITIYSGTIATENQLSMNHSLDLFSLFARHSAMPYGPSIMDSSSKYEVRNIKCEYTHSRGYICQFEKRFR